MENEIVNNPIPNTDTDSPNQNGANLDKKRDELLSYGKIDSDISSYLKDMRESVGPFGPTSIPRPAENTEMVKQSIVRTLKTDTDEAIKINQMSSLSMAMAEQKKKQKEPQTEQSSETPKSQKTLFIIIGFILILAGIGVFKFNYLKNKISLAPETIPDTNKSLIISDYNAELNLEGLEEKDLIIPLLKIIKGKETKINSIENITITKNVATSEKEKEMKIPTTSKEFLFLISSKTPEVLIRSLLPEYMFGIHSFNGNHPFIILKTESYERAFAGMLAWEKNMGNDLENLFSADKEDLNQNSTSTEQTFDHRKNFEDILVKNKDARVLKSSNGSIILIYSIPNKDTILIANDTETLSELFDRVIRSKMIR